MKECSVRLKRIDDGVFQQYMSKYKLKIRHPIYHFEKIKTEKRCEESHETYDFSRKNKLGCLSENANGKISNISKRNICPCNYFNTENLVGTNDEGYHARIIKDNQKELVDTPNISNCDCCHSEESSKENRELLFSTSLEERDEGATQKKTTDVSDLEPNNNRKLITTEDINKLSETVFAQSDKLPVVRLSRLNKKIESFKEMSPNADSCTMLAENSDIYLGRKRCYPFSDDDYDSREGINEDDIETVIFCRGDNESENISLDESSRDVENSIEVKKKKKKIKRSVKNRTPVKKKKVKKKFGQQGNSINETKNGEKPPTKKVFPDKSIEDIVVKVSELVKHLHDSDRIIQQLIKDMPKNTELAGHFKTVISAEQDNFRREIRKNQDVIMKGYDVMLGVSENPSDVPAEISRRTLLSVEDVQNVISRCILIEDSCQKGNTTNEAPAVHPVKETASQKPDLRFSLVHSEPGKFTSASENSWFMVDFSESLRQINKKRLERETLNNVQSPVRGESVRKSQLENIQRERPVPVNHLDPNTPFQRYPFVSSDHQNPSNYIERTPQVITTSFNTVNSNPRLIVQQSTVVPVNHLHNQFPHSVQYRVPPPPPPPPYTYPRLENQYRQPNSRNFSGQRNYPRPSSTNHYPPSHFQSEVAVGRGSQRFPPNNVSVNDPLFVSSYPPNTNVYGHIQLRRNPNNYRNCCLTNSCCLNHPISRGSEINGIVSSNPSRVYPENSVVGVLQGTRLPWDPASSQAAQVRVAMVPETHRPVNHMLLNRHLDRTTIPTAEQYSSPPTTKQSSLPDIPTTVPVTNNLTNFSQFNNTSDSIINPSEKTVNKCYSENQRHGITVEQVENKTEEVLDPTVPQKLTMKNYRLQAGSVLEFQETVEILKEGDDDDDDCVVISSVPNGGCKTSVTRNNSTRVYECAQSGCKNSGQWVCVLCSSVVYCSKDCQKSHWNVKHKDECSKLKELRC